ncbi:MAG: SDR family NAD(P)-dependent oxidoreductase [Ruminococcus flavefaciens]|nr:SDR family NAD(P)-dependent oxidoreductase [Ruminococcus flavefaciens]
MKKALVVGGSNGIGLAVTFSLIERGYYVIILDVAEPDESICAFDGNYMYCHCDLSDMNEEIVTSFSKDNDIELLMITAGIGWVCPFELLHTSEIDKIITINTTSVIKIISIFYERLLNDESFYCGVMCSLAGYVSSPLFSVYAASKSALVRFTESVNIELEKKNSANRILNISPSHIKGTRFGGENTSTDIESVRPVADYIVKSMINHDEIWFPNYDEVISGVLERYNSDPHMFGLSSYEYKVNSGRVVYSPKTRIGYLSGTFDLFHVGHLNLLKRAKSQCDYLIVGVHPDASHKGKQTFIPFDERKSIVESVKYVDKVVDSCPEDCDAWEKYHYTKLFVGSDYKGTERFNRYEEYFKDKGVEIVYFPYTKGTSSTQIREKIINNG